MARGEFELIERYFAPLAKKAPGAFGLKNDAALLDLPEGRTLVTTLDTIVEGVHFLPDSRPEDVACKLLRVNLSDLAAMGAKPFGYLLSVAFPAAPSDDWLDGFAAGLSADQEAFGVVLLGGDTTSTPGPLTLSLTAFGTVEGRKTLLRTTARPGDKIYVSGTIGEGFLGLLSLRGEIAPERPGDAGQFSERYWRPIPRLALGQALLARDLASAALDVSDGLVGDLGHISSGSGLSAVLRAADVPLSPAARRAIGGSTEMLSAVLTGGDDYELLFSADSVQDDALKALARELHLEITCIGEMGPGAGVTVVDARGQTLRLDKPGWRHF